MLLNLVSFFQKRIARFAKRVRKQKTLPDPFVKSLAFSSGSSRIPRTLPTAPDGAGKRPQAPARLPYRPASQPREVCDGGVISRTSCPTCHSHSGFDPESRHSPAPQSANFVLYPQNGVLVRTKAGFSATYPQIRPFLRTASVYTGGAGRAAVVRTTKCPSSRTLPS